jgi:hypothetical protein
MNTNLTINEIKETNEFNPSIAEFKKIIEDMILEENKLKKSCRFKDFFDLYLERSKMESEMEKEIKKIKEAKIALIRENHFFRTFLWKDKFLDICPRPLMDAFYK